jgi:hypothetical protein
VDFIYSLFYLISYSSGGNDEGLVVWLVFLLILYGLGQLSNLLSTLLYRQLVKAGNRNAEGIRIAVLIGIFLTTFSTLAYLYISSLRFER